MYCDSATPLQGRKITLEIIMIMTWEYGSKLWCDYATHLTFMKCNLSEVAPPPESWHHTTKEAKGRDLHFNATMRPLVMESRSSMQPEMRLAISPDHVTFNKSWSHIGREVAVLCLSQSSQRCDSLVVRLCDFGKIANHSHKCESTLL